MAKETIVANKPHRNIHARKEKKSEDVLYCCKERRSCCSPTRATAGFFKEKAKKKYGVIPSVTKLNCLILSLEFPFKVRVIELTRQHCIVFSHWWPCFPFTAFWFTTLFFFFSSDFMQLPATGVAKTLQSLVLLTITKGPTCLRFLCRTSELPWMYKLKIVLCVRFVVFLRLNAEKLDTAGDFRP